MFLEKLQNCGVPEGYPVRLECRVVGMPPPVFYWKKDNETIPSNRERMRYCTITPMPEVSCGWTNCFHENLCDKYRWWCFKNNFFHPHKAVKSLLPCGVNNGCFLGSEQRHDAPLLQSGDGACGPWTYESPYQTYSDTVF